MLTQLIYKAALELNLATTDMELELLEQSLQNIEIAVFRSLWALGLDPIDAAIISENLFQ